MPIGRVHQVAVGVVAERLDDSAINLTLQTDKAPRASSARRKSVSVAV
jgi:hypothetical protein